MEIDRSALDSQDTVFHYTKISKAIEHILYEKRLKFSTGINTNDPREYQSWDLEPHGDGGTYEEFRQICQDAEKSLRKVKESYKYACFCLNDSSLQGQTRLPGYARLRMWAQYGENFYGACVAFSLKSLQERLRDATIYAKPVLYDGDLEHNDTVLSDADANEFMGKNKDDWAAGHMQNHLDQYFFSKHEDYLGEGEYRIVVHDPENAREYLDISGCIKAVLLGDRTAPVYHEIIKKICREMNAECKQVIWQRGRLRLRDI